MTLLTLSRPRGLEKRHTVVPSMENLFNSFFGNDLISKDYAGFVPSVNIREDENSYSIEASAPGFSKNDFKIQVENGILTISGEHKEEQSAEEKNFIRKEFNYGAFNRSFKIEDLVDEDKIDAKYENGILKVTLPKKEEVKSKDVKEIAIN